VNCLRGVLSSVYDVFQPLEAATVIVVAGNKKPGTDTNSVPGI